MEEVYRWNNIGYILTTIESGNNHIESIFFYSLFYVSLDVFLTIQNQIPTVDKDVNVKMWQESKD